jgi:hypothetical protein
MRINPACKGFTPAVVQEGRRVRDVPVAVMPCARQNRHFVEQVAKVESHDGMPRFMECCRSRLPGLTMQVRLGCADCGTRRGMRNLGLGCIGEYGDESIFKLRLAAPFLWYTDTVLVSVAADLGHGTILRFRHRAPNPFENRQLIRNEDFLLKHRDLDHQCRVGAITDRSSVASARLGIKMPRRWSAGPTIGTPTRRSLAASSRPGDSWVRQTEASNHPRHGRFEVDGLSPVSYRPAKRARPCHPGKRILGGWGTPYRSSPPSGLAG